LSLAFSRVADKSPHSDRPIATDARDPFLRRRIRV